jgi:tetratricopeptide (TPR) repeat protein
MKRNIVKILKRSILVLTGFLSMSAFLKSQDTQKGIWLISQEQYTSAKRTLTLCIEADTANAVAMYYLGQVYFLQGNPDSARYYYDNGMRSNPREPLNFIGTGKIYLLQSNRVEGVKLIDKGRKVSTDQFNYYLEAANACVSAGSNYYDLVSTYLEEAKSDKPYDPRLFIAYGDFYMQSKSPGDAVNEYERAVYYDKNCVNAYLSAGKIYAQANNYKDGLNALNKAIEIDPSQILAYRLRGDLFYNFGKYAEAKTDYDTYMLRSDRTLDDQQKYVYILFFSKDYERAGTLISMLLGSNPELTVLYRIMGYIDYETGNYPDGLKNLETFFQHHDTSKFIAQDFAYYGRLLIKNSQDSLGVVQLEKALSIDSSKVELYEDLAKSYAKMKKFGESIDAYNKMLVVNPVNLQNIYYQLGRNYYFMAEDTVALIDSAQRADYYLKADSNFFKMTELSQDSYIGFIWRGRVHSRLDPETALGLAKPDYEQAMVLLEEGDVTKTPKLLIECYRYLAFYYYLLSDKTSSTDPAESRSSMINSINYWNKILALDQNDDQAKTALENLKIE